MSETLILGKLIACSDEDMERIWTELAAGFDEKKNFVIEMDDTFDYPEGRSGEKITRAVTDMDNTQVLCRYLNVGLLDLPEAISDKFGNSNPNLTPSQIKSIFKEITDFLVDAGCKFTVSTD